MHAVCVVGVESNVHRMRIVQSSPMCTLGKWKLFACCNFVIFFLWFDCSRCDAHFNGTAIKICVCYILFIKIIPFMLIFSSTFLARVYIRMFHIREVRCKLFCCCFSVEIVHEIFAIPSNLISFCQYSRINLFNGIDRDRFFSRIPRSLEFPFAESFAVKYGIRLNVAPSRWLTNVITKHAENIC